MNQTSMVLNVIVPELHDYHPWIYYNNFTKTWTGFFLDFILELERKTKLRYKVFQKESKFVNLCPCKITSLFLSFLSFGYRYLFIISE